MPYLIMIASLAAVAAVEKAAGVNAAIKWPNDVLVGGKKVCGILIENGVRADKRAFAIVGIGINVGLRPEDFSEIADSAAGLSAAAGRDIDPREVLRPLCEDFERLYLQLPDGRAVFAAWRRRLLTLGKPVRARWGDGIIEGVAADVEENGALLIRRADGALARVVAGDVTLADK
jgi:BirA family biotin operon repressor/biotin-[acetyl-CoA-carboxylase] ligase